MPALGNVRLRARSTWRLLLREAGAYAVVGAACFVLDLALFWVLYTAAGFGAVGAKLVSTLVAMTTAYVAHRLWSFAYRARTGFRREYLLFAAVNAVTLLQGLAIVWLVRHPLGQESAEVLQVANVGSIALGTVVRFVSYRRWVFPAHDAPAAVRAALAGEVAVPGPPPESRTAG